MHGASNRPVSLRHQGGLTAGYWAVQSSSGDLRTSVRAPRLASRIASSTPCAAKRSQRCTPTSRFATACNRGAVRRSTVTTDDEQGTF